MNKVCLKILCLAAIVALIPSGLMGQGSGPDVIVGALTGPSNYGSSGGVSAFALGTTSCNIGNQPLIWIANTNQHPVIGQNLYKYLNGRFSMVGRSWLKHGFTALQQNLCGGCNANPNGTALGVGCSDPYSSGLNGSQSGLGPRFEVNAANGQFPYPYTNSPPASGNIARRLQVNNTDLNTALNAGARYFAEGQYIHPTDAGSGNGANNASYREASISGGGTSYNMGFIGSTVQQQAAIYAWQSIDPAVIINTVDVPNEGRYIVAYTTTAAGPPGVNHYEFAIHNLNSDQSASSVTINLGCNANATNVGFSQSFYHSGEPYANAPWTSNIASNGIVWQTQQTFSQNQNADALRWGSLNNYWFDSAQPPTSLTIGLFKPGAVTSVSLSLSGGPGGQPEYQTNSFNATLDVNGLVGSSSTPATVNAAVGSTNNLNFFSFNPGQPWDLGYGTAPLVPASGCAILSSDGQVLNLDITDPTLGTWFNVMANSPGFFNFNLNFSLPLPTTLSMQMIIAAPNQPSGIALSQPVRMIVQ